MSGEPLLAVENLHVLFGKSHVIKGVSFEVQPGEIVAILGRNGAGKSTTLKAVMGLVKVQGGKLRLNGQEISGLPPYQRAQLGIGYVPQDRYLFPGLTVLENLLAVMRDPSDKELLEEVFTLFPTLKARQHQLAVTLSGGEQQMVAIARALVTRPKLVIMDEATTGLMPSAVSHLRDKIDQLNRSGVTFLLVEEKVPFALSLAHRIFFMEQGVIVYGAEASAVRGNTDLFLRYLGVRARAYGP